MTGGVAVLKNRDFRLYLGSRFCASIATQMMIMAVGWQVYHITGRVLDLGLIGLSQFLPFLCLVLFSGHVADQFDRRLIIMLGPLRVCGLYRAAAQFCVVEPADHPADLRGAGFSRHHPGLSNACRPIIRPHDRDDGESAQCAGAQLLGQSGRVHLGTQRRRHRLCDCRRPARTKHRCRRGLWRGSDTAVGCHYAGVPDPQAPRGRQPRGA